MGGLVAVLGVGFGMLLFVLRITLGDKWANQGVFTLFAILFIFVGLQFMGMGLLGEYIGRIYHDVRGRPLFFLDRVAGQSQLAHPEASSAQSANEVTQ